MRKGDTRAKHLFRARRKFMRAKMFRVETFCAKRQIMSEKRLFKRYLCTAMLSAILQNGFYLRVAARRTKVLRVTIRNYVEFYAY